MTFSECSQVSLVSQAFRSSNITTFDEFRWFNGLDAKLSDNAFYGCSNLKSITLPSCITRLGDYCLSSTGAIKRLDLSHIERIEDLKCPLQTSKVESIIFSESLTYLGRRSFYRDFYLKQIYFYGHTAPNAHSDWANDMRSTYVSNQRIYIPIGATGYEFLEVAKQFGFEIVECL